VVRWVPVFHIRAGGTLGCKVHYNSATTDFFNGGPLSPNTWYHFALTHNRQGTTNPTVLYVNGQAVANSTKADRLASAGTGSSSRFLMGATSTQLPRKTITPLVC
jgi:hypothetical protein